MKKEEYQILTASWIMASNDENNLITYRSIGKRLDITNLKKIKNIILSHGELFRRGASKDSIHNWKSKMLDGFQQPSWLLELELNKQELEKEILKLSAEDIFRSQFRTKQNSEKSSIEIMDWGLRYLERLYTNESSQFKSIVQVITLILVLVSFILQIID